jgi:hypothetical protein
VLRERPDWAAAWRMAPLDWPRLVAARESPDPEVRFAALDSMGLTLALLGAHGEQLEIDAEAVELRPRAAAPRRRQVFAWLRLGRPHEALTAARELRALAPGDAQAAELLRIAQAVAGAGARAADPALLARLPLLSRAEAARALGGRFASVSLDRQAGAPSRRPPARSRLPKK